MVPKITFTVSFVSHTKNATRATRNGGIIRIQFPILNISRVKTMGRSKNEIIFVARIRLVKIMSERKIALAIR